MVSSDDAGLKLAGIPDPVAFLEGLFAHSPVAFQVYGVDGHSRLTNPAFRRLFGADPPPDYNILEDEIAAERGVLDLFHRAFTGEVVHVPPVWYDPRELEQVKVVEGRRAAVAATFFPLRDRSGAVAYVAIVFEDLTAEMEAREEAEAGRAEAQAAVREREESLALLDTLMSNAPVGLAFVNPELRYVRVNQAMADINGRPISALVGRTLEEINPKLAVDLIPVYRRVLELGEAVVNQELTGEVGSRPGEQRHWLTSHYPVRTTSGATVGVGVVVHEITERKFFEDAQRFLAEGGAELARSLDLGSTVAHIAQFPLSRLADGCSVYLLDGGTVQRAEVAHSDPRKAELLRDIEDRYPLGPESHHPAMVVASTGRSLLLTQITPVMLERFARDAEHARMLAALGAQSGIAVALSGHRGVIGSIFFVNGASSRRYRKRDLLVAEGFAARAALALENARLYEEAQRAISSREAISAVVSHDLRTPLASILMSAELLDASDPADVGVAEVRRHAAVIRRSAEGIQRLLRDLEDAREINADALPLERVESRIEDIVQEGVSRCQPMADHKGLDLVIDSNGGAGTVYCDPDRILQVLSNLLDNAMKFTPPDGLIRLHITRKPAEYRICVSNTGEGISEEDQARSFERYWSGNEHGGTGLGLFIAKGIVEAHGGRIWVQSRPGEDATFCFTLPRAPDAMDSA